MNVLLIDSYDSFTFNLAALIRDAIPGSRVHVIHNDDYSEPAALEKILPYFHAVVVGPGPGSPDDPKAVGVIPYLWQLSNDLPVLGVCLGHQALCLAFGGQLERLKEVKHGQRSILRHSGDNLFQGVDRAEVVRYHSLHVTIPLGEEDNLSEIIPLAWATDVLLDGPSVDVLMAARHRTKPFWGVQYHPESICTVGGGLDVVANFGRLATEWNKEHARDALVALPSDWRATLKSNDLHPIPLTSTAPFLQVQSSIAPMTVLSTTATLRGAMSVPQICDILRSNNEISETDDFVVLESRAAPGRHTIIGMITRNTLRISSSVGDDSVTLHSGEASRKVPLGVDETIWSWLARFMENRKAVGGQQESPFWGGFVGIINYEAGVSTLEVPILARSEKRGDDRSTQASSRPDIVFAFIERSVVIDQQENTAYVQSIRRGRAEAGLDKEHQWISSTVALLQTITEPAFTPTATPPIPVSNDVSSSESPQSSQPSLMKVEQPNKDMYIAKIAATQEYLNAGESYEICLTALTRITLPILPPTKSPTELRAWRLWKTLRLLNPAPYSGYVRLCGTTLVASSPERFLSWTRDGLCQLRPIKGTVKKARPDGAPEVTREEAEKMLLGSPKEIAENLMIVDLIRHDLHRVVSASAASVSVGACAGPEDGKPETVNVSKLFAVEEYETVFQLVSVIEGKVDTAKGYTGWDVLSRSLPPGSMTGAPKKRSVELLQDLESEWIPTSEPQAHDLPLSSSHGKITALPSITSKKPLERGVYSGVFGYWCVGGGGDFSVIIRSAFRYDDESIPVSADKAGTETWYLGAGGAITALSDPNDEWEEMQTKLSSSLRSFSYI